MYTSAEPLVVTPRQAAARRAEALLAGDRGVTQRYAEAAVEAGLIDPDDLRSWWCEGRGKPVVKVSRTGKRQMLSERWFMA